jgi:heme/copper-type cytochrome/quinol oxidase subunit 4
VWLSQGLTTFAYLFTGIFAHAVAGDANWMTSPATLSLDDGPGRDACHALIVICFPTALLVDGTVLVSRVRAHFQPLISAAFGRVAAATGSAAEEGARAGAPVFRSDPEKLRTMEGDTDDGFAAERAGARTHWSWSIQLWWLLWCGLTMLAATVVATATAAFSKLVGVIAALAACQTSVTWPGALFYQLHERSRRRQEECYYHGNGTSPCRCSRRNGILSLRLVVALLGLVLGVGGVWGNSIDMASRWRGEKPLRLFACDGSSHVKAAAAVGGPLLEYMP